MSEYIVSARKYRPDSFETLIGQDNIAQTLKNSITRGQLAHAYLFCGPRGVGKTSAARIFAKTINCAHPTADMEPCGECESCRSFAEGRSYCIHELDAASNNGVDDIKALMDKVQIPPQVGRYSVYIIDEVHMLSQAAFNAFLKTLEEPPAHAIFILATTEKHKIIPTILSRCQTYDFNRIGVPDIVRNLKGIASKENISIDDESLHVIANKADGAMRDALTIFDQTVAFCGTDIRYEDVIRNLNVLDYEYSFKLVDAFLAKDHATALLTFDDILRKGFNSLHFVTALSAHLRDLLVSKTGGLDSLLDLPDSLKARYRDQASRCSLKFIFDALGVTTQCEAGYRAAANQRLHIEYALMKLSFLAGVPEVSSAADKSDGSTLNRTSASLHPSQQSWAPPVYEATGGHGPVEGTAVTQKKDAAEGTAAIKNTNNVAAEPAVEPIIEAVELDIEPEIIEVAAPAPAPAPAPSPATAAKPVARKRPAKTGASLSMDSLLNEMPEIELAPVEEETKKEVLPDDETLAARWQDLAKETPQPRLANALANAKLAIREEDGNKIIEFSVTNEAQKRWIEEKMLHDLEGRIRKLTASNKVRLVPSVVPEENTEPVIYMPAEKAEYLIKNNPEVRDLVTDLGLDI